MCMGWSRAVCEGAWACGCGLESWCVKAVRGRVALRCSTSVLRVVALCESCERAFAMGAVGEDCDRVQHTCRPHGASTLAGRQPDAHSLQHSGKKPVARAQRHGASTLDGRQPDAHSLQHAGKKPVARARRQGALATTSTCAFAPSPRYGHATQRSKDPRYAGRQPGDYHAGRGCWTRCIGVPRSIS